MLEFWIQKNISINDIRFALKQEEQRREMRKVEGRSFKDHELIPKVKERSKNDICCFKCGMRGHMAVECSRNQRCFNCQGYNHIAANCRKSKQNIPSTKSGRAGNFQWESQGKYTRQNLGRDEISMRTSDEAVMKVNEISAKMGLNDASETHERGKGEYENERYNLWLLDSRSINHMTQNEFMCNDMIDERKQISLADKNDKILILKGISDVIVKQSSGKSNIRLKNVLCVPDLNSNLLSVAKITDQRCNVNFNKFGALQRA